MHPLFWAAVLTLALSASCKRSDQEPKVGGSGPGVPARTPGDHPRPKATGSVPLPELALADRLGVADLADAEAPASSEILRWNFAEKRTYTYDYNQEMHARVAGEDLDDFPEVVHLKARFLIKAAGDGTAEVAVKDGLATQARPDAAGAEPVAMPPMVIQGVREDGTQAEPSLEEWYLRLLLSLPSRPLEVGETDELAFVVPVNASGSTIYGRGALKITLARFVLVAGRRAALLESSIEVAGLDIPEDLEGSYAMSLRARGLLLIELAERMPLRGQLALSMRLVSAFDALGEDEVIDLSQDHFIDISRRAEP